MPVVEAGASCPSSFLQRTLVRVHARRLILVRSLHVSSCVRFAWPCTLSAPTQGPRRCATSCTLAHAQLLTDATAHDACHWFDQEPAECICTQDVVCRKSFQPGSAASQLRLLSVSRSLNAHKRAFLGMSPGSTRPMCYFTLCWLTQRGIGVAVAAVLDARALSMLSPVAAWLVPTAHNTAAAHAHSSSCAGRAEWSSVCKAGSSCACVIAHATVLHVLVRRLPR